MQEKTGVPAIRFAGFTNDWEQRKVKNVAPLQRGFDLPAAQMEDGEYPVVMSNGVGGYHSKFKVKGPGVITGRSGTIGRLHYIEDDYWPHNTSLWVTNFKGNYPKFIYYLYQKLDLSQFGSGSGVPTLNRNDVHDALVEIPQTHEQQRIAEWFDYLDHLITLHQRKYTCLSNIKKSMLERMFPQNGATVPEIRFAGFTDDWEQCRLETISDVRDGTHDSPVYQNEGHPFVTSKNVKDGFINYDDIQYISDEDFEEINKRSKVDVNDILMGMIGTIGNLALIRTEPDFAIKNVALIKDTQQVSYLYLYYYLQSKNVEKQLLSGMDGGTQKFFSLKKIRELNILVPSEGEQLQIGRFLENFNHLITLHQRELQRLQNIKKSCLEKMFV